MRTMHRQRRSGSIRRPWLSMVALGLLLAVPAMSKPPRLRIQPHTVRPRYAYRLGARTLRVQRDCHRSGRVLLHLRIQVLNRGTRRIDLPVRLQAALDVPGAGTLQVPVPAVKPGGHAWLRVDLPYVPDRRGVHQATLRVALLAAGQTWNRLSLPAPPAGAACPPDRRRAARPPGEDLP